MTAQKPEKPRRGRPPKIDPAHILKVAREVFLARGIRATTQEVAERAGVSEGSIFYRFKSKEGLFREAMEVSEDDMPSLVLVALSSMNSESIEESLQTLGQALIDIARVGLPLMMMSWSNPTVGSACDEPNALKFREIVTRLSSYFEAQMDAGRLAAFNLVFAQSPRIMLGGIAVTQTPLERRVDQLGRRIATGVLALAATLTPPYFLASLMDFLLHSPVSM